jgi:hypothetical protein
LRLLGPPGSKKSKKNASPPRIEAMAASLAKF